MPGRTALLILFGACKKVLGVHLQVHHATELSARQLSLRKNIGELRAKIQFRFAHVDADGDGEVSFEEMKRGFGHEPVAVGEDILREMLVDCTGGDTAATSCTHEQMESRLEEWVDSHSARSSLALLQTDGQRGFRPVDGEPGDDLELPCGPSAATPDEGLEGVKCTVVGAKCFHNGGLLAWSLHDICEGRTCICKATSETKRLAKLGLMGATSTTTALNFSDPGDEVMAPNCGENWEVFKVSGHIEDVDQLMSASEKKFVWAAMPTYAPSTAKHLDEPSTRPVETEVALYKTARHRLSKDGKYGKVCMMSWQSTRSAGDWKTNLLFNEEPFVYARQGLRLKAPKGIVLTYESTRSKLKSLFEQECCNENFKADKIIISGHSHGGAMAELHAVDVVSNWECPRGRDLGAKDLAVVLVAPHRGMWSNEDVNKVWSCNDAKSCLAGSAITILTQGDYVGDGTHDIETHRATMHPAEVAWLPCPSIPEGANYNNSEERYEFFWCHGIHNYVSLVEQKLVGEAGWGSSCGGACGDPNRLVQCTQWTLFTGTGCSYAKPEKLPPTTACPASAWLPREERCDCHFDLCTEITHHGCKI